MGMGIGDAGFAGGGVQWACRLLEQYAPSGPTGPSMCANIDILLNANKICFQFCFLFFVFCFASEGIIIKGRQQRVSSQGQILKSFFQTPIRSKQTPRVNQ